MRLVLLTGEGIEHRYVTRHFLAAFGDSLVAIVVPRPPSRPWQRIRSYWKRYSVPQLVSRIAQRLRARLTHRAERREATYRRLLMEAGDTGDELPGGDRVRVVPSLNGATTQRLLGELQPDIIAVYGTNVVKPEIMRLARVAILNMHTGISPRYRGSDTVFWALHNEEPEWVGVTIHALDAGLDSGPIYATGRPELAPDDDEDSLFCKCVRVGTPLYIETVRAVANGTARPAPQELASGREYRFADRTVRAERRVERLLREGLLRRAPRTPVS